MKLWTILDKSIYDNIKIGNEYFSHQPEFVDPIVKEWFIQKTKFSHWPIWCWLNTPSKDDIANHFKQTSHQNSLVILEMHVPNNEKMIFFQDHVWEYVLNYKYIDNEKHTSIFYKECEALGISHLHSIPPHYEDLHLRIQDSWNKLFDLRWCEKVFGKNDLRICIDFLHPHWLESSYIVHPEQFLDKKD